VKVRHNIFCNQNPLSRILKSVCIILQYLYLNGASYTVQVLLSREGFMLWPAGGGEGGGGVRWYIHHTHPPSLPEASPRGWGGEGGGL
jgi:hypothetical protein